MNNKIVNIVVFGAGVLIGSLVTGYIVKNKYEQIIEDEVASVREMAARRRNYERAEAPADGNMENKVKEAYDALDRKDVEDERKIISMRKEYKSMARGYGQIRDEDEINEAKEVEERTKYERISTGDIGDGKPYVISIEQFSEEMDHFDKTTIYYYENDDTLADADEEVIVDMYAAVGEDALFEFDENNNVVYVRNERISTDYEIIRLRQSYAQAVAGYTPPRDTIRRGRDNADK